MIPGKYNIDIWRGGTWSIGIQQDTLDFAEYDEIRMQIRPPFVKGIPLKPALLELTLTSGRITIEESNLILRLMISAADTKNLAFDEGVYDLELVKYVDLDATPAITEETVDKILYGKVTVHGEQTV